MRKTDNVPGLAGINAQQRLYVRPCGKGYTCLGFDNAHRATVKLAGWLNRPDLLPPPRKGTVKAWRAYRAAMDAASARCTATGERCPVDLTPELVGLEGRRVEVRTPTGETRRFTVGKSTGWMPVHLEIKTARSMGGGAAYVPAGSTVRVVRWAAPRTEWAAA